MNTISDFTCSVNTARSNPQDQAVARRRLDLLAFAATHTHPTVTGWAQLHTALNELAPLCADSPDLADLHAHVDQLLGGFRRPGGGQ